jgi:hypothetical protein
MCVVFVFVFCICIHTYLHMHTCMYIDVLVYNGYEFIIFDIGSQKSAFTLQCTYIYKFSLTFVFSFLILPSYTPAGFDLTTSSLVGGRVADDTTRPRRQGNNVIIVIIISL